VINCAFIIDEISNNIVLVSTHKHGCCVVQWCLDHATPDQQAVIIRVIIDKVLHLVQDAYGNYVVQQLMDMDFISNGLDIREAIVRRLLGNLSKLSVQKFSSIVVEKCIQLADPHTRRLMIVELTNVARLPRLLKDPYANYVIQRLLQTSSVNERQILFALIKPHLPNLGKTTFGKRIQAQMLRKFPGLASYKAPRRQYYNRNYYWEHKNNRSF